MTTSTAANVARDSENKEKAERNSTGKTGAAVPAQAEKRRALGRGLDSLLPGPRVVTSNPAPTQQTGQQQVPHRVFDSVRNDTAEGDRGTAVGNAVTGGDAANAALGNRVEGYRHDGVIRAEADPKYLTEEERAATKSPLLATPARNGAPMAELRSTGQPGAAVPTYSSSAAGVQQAPHRVFDSVRTDITSGRLVGEESEQEIEILAMAESRTPSNFVVNLALEQIDKNPFQTRYVDDNDNLEELAESIKTNGVVQPIVVRPAEEDGRFVLILGERRLHASKKAGKTTIPAIVRRVSDQQAAEMTIIENLQREDLSALEQAEAFRVLSRDFHLTQAQIGERIGLSRQSVANYMRLLKLPRDVMELLAEKKLTFHEAREMLALSSDDQISQAALYAVKHGLSIEQIERLVLSMNGDLPAFPGMPGAVKKRTGGARWVDPNVRSAQVDLERLLGVRVRIRDRKGKGKIVIEYGTVDDYERVVEMLRGKK
jgi:ParB family transcriptional regulator, chromosome partitioning protein